jgi:hypothetical protein
MNAEKQRLLNAMSIKPGNEIDNRTGLCKLIGVACSILLVITMMMPFASGPMGITISGWKIMGGVSGLFMAAFILVSLLSAISRNPILVSLGGLGLLVNMMVAIRKIDAMAAEIQSHMNGDNISDAVATVLAGQVGLSWGGGLSLLLAVILIANPFFRTKKQ